MLAAVQDRRHPFCASVLCAVSIDREAPENIHNMVPEKRKRSGLANRISYGSHTFKHVAPADADPPRHLSERSS